jgi:hypothetical protein
MLELTKDELMFLRWLRTNAGLQVYQNQLLSTTLLSGF